MSSPLVVLGCIQIEHYLSVTEFPRQGQFIRIQDYQLQRGGHGAIQALTAQRCGVDTTLIANIGQDPDGLAIKRELADAGVCTSAIQEIPHLNTGMVMKCLSENGDCRGGIASGANAALTPEQLSVHLDLIAKAAGILLLQEIPQATIELAARHARAHGTQVLLNATDLEHCSSAMLKLVDCVILNMPTAELWLGEPLLADDDLVRVCEQLHTAGVSRVCLTMGEAGVWISQSSSGGQHLEAYPCQSVDPRGISDVFSGALASQLVGRHALLESVQFAQAAAACSLQQVGSITSVPDGWQVHTFQNQQIQS